MTRRPHLCAGLRQTPAVTRAARAAKEKEAGMSVVRRVAFLLSLSILGAALATTVGQGASLSSVHGLDPNPAGHDRGKSDVDPAAHHSLREPVTGRQPGDQATTDPLPPKSGASGDAPSSDLAPGQKPGEPRPVTRPSPQDSTVNAPPSPR